MTASYPRRSCCLSRHSARPNEPVRTRRLTNRDSGVIGRTLAQATVISVEPEGAPEFGEVFEV